ncbi:MAG: hypothetical protein QM760_02780 [Nibricoccus sp.]
MGFSIASAPPKQHLPRFFDLSDFSQRIRPRDPRSLNRRRHFRDPQCEPDDLPPVILHHREFNQHGHRLRRLPILHRKSRELCTRFRNKLSSI